MKYSMKKEDIKKKKALSEDELLNVSGGMRPSIPEASECPTIKEKDECKKHEECVWTGALCERR